jgi:hypothetical protein
MENPEVDRAFREGVAAGMDNAGEMILAALMETPIDRIKGICRGKLISQHDIMPDVAKKSCEHEAYTTIEFCNCGWPIGFERAQK